MNQSSSIDDSAIDRLERELDGALTNSAGRAGPRPLAVVAYRLDDSESASPQVAHSRKAQLPALEASDGTRAFEESFGRLAVRPHEVAADDTTSCETFEAFDQGDKLVRELMKTETPKSSRKKPVTRLQRDEGTDRASVTATYARSPASRSPTTARSPPGSGAQSPRHDSSSDCEADAARGAVDPESLLELVRSTLPRPAPVDSGSAVSVEGLSQILHTPHRLSGWLYKLGEKGVVMLAQATGYRKRWFLIDPASGGKLIYCRNQEAEPRGFIDMDKCVTVRRRDDNLPGFVKFRFAFEIVTPRRTWLLLAATHDERRYWLDGLEAYIRPKGGAEDDDGPDKIVF